MPNLALRCENIHKKLGKKEILKDVSLSVERGDILGFIGPNGAGKTTTIKLILGLQSISEGTVKINGYDVEKQFTKAIENVGAIVENPDLYMYLTGYQNLQLIANLYPKVDDKRIQEVINIVGLEKRIHDKVSKYSLGMRQRLGLAQAILHRPNLLILDEPTNGLDPEGIKEMRQLLVKLASEEHMGILISSHNLLELESFCNKIAIIKNGEIIETSSIEDTKNLEASQTYIVTTNSAKLSKLAMKPEWMKEEIEVMSETSIKIHTEKEMVPLIVKELVEKEINVYEVKEEKMSLEEAFLKKTGGNVID